MTFTFLDIETTGLNPRRDEIIEVAMLRWPENDHRLFSLPISEQNADENALEINHYWERRDELLRREVTQRAAEANFLWGLKDRVVVGNNVQFDLRFIEEWLIYHDVEDSTPWHYHDVEDSTPWHYHPIDIKAFVAGRHWNGYHALGLPPWSTADIARAAEVPLPSNAHSAFADAKWNRDVFLKFFELVDRYGNPVDSPRAAAVRELEATR